MVDTVSVFRRLDASETDSGGRASAAGCQIVFEVAHGLMTAVSGGGASALSPNRQSFFLSL